MKKVITYGTYDLFHQGHYNLLKHAKELGDYLIVGVTSEAFDQARGKLNVRDSLVKRIENVRKSGFADEIIVEEYMGQKIDDIKRYGIDIFTVGSDWVGHFDYLNEFCKVHYLERTKGISSTDIRNRETIRLGVWGAGSVAHRFCLEAKFVSGLEVTGIYREGVDEADANELAEQNQLLIYEDWQEFMEEVDAVYICTPLQEHARCIRMALEAGKHVICETPFMSDAKEAEALFELAGQKKLILFHGLKTAYCPAFLRMVSLSKTGLIGNVLTVDASFTKIFANASSGQVRSNSGGSMNALGEYPLLAAIKLLGTDFRESKFFSRKTEDVDGYTWFYLGYEHSMAKGTVAIDAKKEGCLTIAGTKGYLYVPSPWWKTEYFEARFENFNKNMKYFYKFQGEGFRYEIAEFVRCILKGQGSLMLTKEESLAMARTLEQYRDKVGVETF